MESGFGILNDHLATAAMQTTYSLQSTITAKDFVSALKDTAASSERLRSLDLDEITVGLILRSSIAIPKELEYSVDVDILSELQRNFDLSDIDIGMMTFFTKSVSRPGYLDFGGWDTNYVGWNLETNEINVMSSETYELLYRWSSSPENFLKALIESKRFFNERPFNDMLWEDLPTIERYATQIAEISGGPQYEAFFRIFLGVF